MKKIVLAALAGASLATAAMAEKEINLLTIGNSFSNNSTRYLPQMLEAGGLKVHVNRSASLGGRSLADHIGYAKAHEANPADPKGMPYNWQGIEGKRGKTSLQDILKAKKWDIVTIQQVSHQSWQADTFRPAADELVALIRKLAPQAKIVMQETWSYRSDSPYLPKQNMDQRAMYEKLHQNYYACAKALKLDGVMPVGTAFQTALADPEWGVSFETVTDPAKFKHPESPASKHSLHVGWRWYKDRKSGEYRLSNDPNHASKYGEYLGAAVWYEYLFGGVTGNTFRPRDLTDSEAKKLQQIAVDTVKKAKAEEAK